MVVDLQDIGDEQALLSWVDDSFTWMENSSLFVFKILDVLKGVFLQSLFYLWGNVLLRLFQDQKKVWSTQSLTY